MTSGAWRAIMDCSVTYMYMYMYTLWKFGCSYITLKIEQKYRIKHVYNGKDVFLWLQTRFGKSLVMKYYLLFSICQSIPVRPWIIHRLPLHAPTPSVRVSLYVTVTLTGSTDYHSISLPPLSEYLHTSEKL